eukprot:2039306-Prymnesium_polylepis.1
MQIIARRVRLLEVFIVIDAAREATIGIHLTHHCRSPHFDRAAFLSDCHEEAVASAYYRSLDLGDSIAQSPVLVQLLRQQPPLNARKVHVQLASRTDLHHMCRPPAARLTNIDKVAFLRPTSFRPARRWLAVRLTGWQ